MKEDKCPWCLGTGACQTVNPDPDTGKLRTFPCPWCWGTGDKEKCPACGGESPWNLVKCRDCNSTRYATAQPVDELEHVHDDTCKAVIRIRNTTIDEGIKVAQALLTREKARYCAEARHEAFYKAYNILHQFAPTGDVTAWDAMKAFEKAQRAIEAEAAEQTKIAEGADEGR